ncbi:ribonuclease H-like domain-containing protein [Tanacetum coccineum]
MYQPANDDFSQHLSDDEASYHEDVSDNAWQIWQWTIRTKPDFDTNLAMTMRTKPDVDTLSIDDLYNNLRVFKQELISTLKSSASAQNVAFVSQSKREKFMLVPTVLILLLLRTIFKKGKFMLRMDINWQIAMIAIRMKKFYKKIRRRVRADRKAPVGFDKEKLECFNCHNTGHFTRECTAKGTHDGKNPIPVMFFLSLS